MIYNHTSVTFVQLPFIVIIIPCLQIPETKGGEKAVGKSVLKLCQLF